MKSNVVIIKSAILLLLVVSFFGFKPSYASLEDYNFVIAVGDGWQAGTDEYWHLSPLNQRSEFYIGEKIHFFAQSDYINVAHTWTVKIKSGENLIQELKINYDPGQYGWNYSNYTPWTYNLEAGEYVANFYINVGSGDMLIGSKNIKVLNELKDGLTPYVFSHALTATSWQYGVDGEYWNLKPVQQKTEFSAGENVQLLVQVKNIYLDHRYKVVLQKEGVAQWEFSSDWLGVDEKWVYGNFYPVYYKAQPGSYNFKVYIDIGKGFVDLATVPFNVTGEITKYSYTHTYLATGFGYGEGDNYWDLKAVNPKTVFNKGETVFALAQVKNISYAHQWKVELYKGENKLWDFEDKWREVGAGWEYGNFFPAYYNAQPGQYTFKIYLNIGEGYILLDTKKFTVEGEIEKPSFYRAVTATGWLYGTGDHYWNLSPVGEKSQFQVGENVHLMTQVRNIYVDHRYKVELYKEGKFSWAFETDLLKVGSGWPYSNFFPIYYNAQMGNYEFWYYLDTGNGFELHGKKAFTVQ